MSQMFLPLLISSPIVVHLLVRYMGPCLKVVRNFGPCFGTRNIRLAILLQRLFRNTIFILLLCPLVRIYVFDFRVLLRYWYVRSDV